MKQKVHSAQSTLKKHTQEAHSHLFTSALRSVKAFRHIALVAPDLTGIATGGVNCHFPAPYRLPISNRR